MGERVKSLLGKMSQEALIILAIGLTVFVSLFAGWSSLAGQIDELRRAMYEGDARLRQERREDMAALRNEMSELRREVRDDFRAMGQRMDRLTESLIHAIPDLKQRLEAPGTGSEPLQKPGSEARNP